MHSGKYQSLVASIRAQEIIRCQSESFQNTGSERVNRNIGSVYKSFRECQPRWSRDIDGDGPFTTIKNVKRGGFLVDSVYTDDGGAPIGENQTFTRGAISR